MSRRKQLNPKAIKVEEEEEFTAETCNMTVPSHDTTFEMSTEEKKLRVTDDSEDDRLVINESQMNESFSTGCQSQHSPGMNSFDSDPGNQPGNNADSASDDNLSGNYFPTDRLVAVKMENELSIGSDGKISSDVGFGSSQYLKFTSKSRRKSDRILPLPDNDGRNNFKCPICNEILTNNHELTKHIRSHNSPSEVAPTINSCKICGKILSSMSSLDRHMLVHSGERPFQCRICDMAFTTNGNMHRHMRIHAKGEHQDVLDQGFLKDGVAYKPPKKKRVMAHNSFVNILPKKIKQRSSLENESVHLIGSDQILTNFSISLPSFISPRQIPKQTVIEVNHSSTKHICSLCNFQFYSLYGFLEHLSDHDWNAAAGNTVFKCLPCSFVSSSFSDFQSHLHLKHELSEVPLRSPKKGKTPSDSSLSPSSQSKIVNPVSDDVNLMEFTTEKFPLVSTNFQTLDVNNNSNCSGRLLSREVGVPQREKKTACTESSSSSSHQSPLVSLTATFQSKQSVVSSCSRMCGTSFLSSDVKNIHELTNHVPSDIFARWCSERKPENDDGDPRDGLDQREFMLFFGLLSVARKNLGHRPSNKSKVADVENQVRSAGLMIPLTIANESVDEDFKPSDIEELRRQIISNALPASLLAHPSPLLSTSPAEILLQQHHQYKYSDCTDSSSSKQDKTNRGERQYKCLICFQSFTTKANCERHLRKKHKLLMRDDIERYSAAIKPAAAEEERPRDSPRPHETVCKYCGEDFKMERALKHHLRSQSSCQHKPYTCQACNTGFSTKANCLRHIQKQHSLLPQPVESHMRVNKELLEAQKKLNLVTNGSSLSNFDLIPNYLNSLDSNPEMLSGRNSANMTMISPFQIHPSSSSKSLNLSTVTAPILDLSHANIRLNSDGECRSLGRDEPLDFSVRKDHDSFKTSSELPMDLSLKKTTSTNKHQSSLPGNSASISLPPGKSPLISMKSILKPLPQVPVPSPAVQHNNASLQFSDPQKHYNPRTNRYHCHFCGAIFQQSLKLQYHLLTHNPTVAPSSFNNPSSVSSSSPSETSHRIHLNQMSNMSKTNEENSLELQTYINNNNNNPACKNNNTTTLPTSIADLQDSDLADPSQISNLAAAIPSFLSPSSLSLPSSLLNSSDGSALFTGLKSKSRFFLPGSSECLNKKAQSTTLGFNKRLKLSLSGRRNSYSDSPHKLKCNFCSRAFPWVSSLKRHILTHTGHKPFKCLRCPVTFSTKSNRERHMMRKHGIDLRDQTVRQLLDQNYNCHLCESVSFSRLDFLLEHHRDMHPNVDSTSAQLPHPPVVIMPQHFSDEEMKNDDLQEEVHDSPQKLANTEAESEEDECNKSEQNEFHETQLNSIADLDMSKIMASLASTTFMKPTSVSCGFVSPSPSSTGRSSSSMHMNPERDNYNVDKITKCWKCEQMFDCRKGLLRHLKEHNVDLPFKCYLCDASYENRLNSLLHKESMHHQDWISVKEKNKVGEDIQNYSNFMDQLVEETLAGNLQGRKIVRQEGIDLDLRPETDYAQRKVFCSLCPKRFWSLQDLRRHMRSHTGERPFKCDICDALFTLKHSMMRHRRKHVAADDSNFSFNVSNKNNNNLNSHENSVNNYDELEDCPSQADEGKDGEACLPEEEEVEMDVSDNFDGELVIDESDVGQSEDATVEESKEETVMMTMMVDDQYKIKCKEELDEENLGDASQQ